MQSSACVQNESLVTLTLRPFIPYWKLRPCVCVGGGRHGSSKTGPSLLPHSKQRISGEGRDPKSEEQDGRGLTGNRGASPSFVSPLTYTNEIQYPCDPGCRMANTSLNRPRVADPRIPRLGDRVVMGVVCARSLSWSCYVPWTIYFALRSQFPPPGD